MKIESTTEATADALAHLLGITARQVQRLVKAGAIPRSGRGLYDLPICVQSWGAYIAHGKTTAELGSERRRLVSAQAHRAESENRLRDGELLDAEDVSIVLSEAMTIIATGMDSLGGRLASELAGIDDPAIIRQKLLSETRRIRATAADKLVALADLGRDRKGKRAPAAKRRS